MPSEYKPVHKVDVVEVLQVGEAMEEMQTIQRADAKIKRHIRLLRLLSHIIATVLSAGTFIPLATTVNKFIRTRNIYHDVPAPTDTDPTRVISRTAWAHDSKVWPTYMYFGIATISMFLNFSILLAYLKSVQAVGKVSRVNTIVNGAVLIGNIVVWAAATAMYRYEKDTNGKSNDLWGWTCSDAADSIQQIFSEEITFNTYCNAQSASWFLGILKVVSLLLTGFIYLLALRRRKTKKQVRKSMINMENASF